MLAMPRLSSVESTIHSTSVEREGCCVMSRSRVRKRALRESRRERVQVGLRGVLLQHGGKEVDQKETTAALANAVRFVAVVGQRALDEPKEAGQMGDTFFARDGENERVVPRDELDPVLPADTANERSLGRRGGRVFTFPHPVGPVRMQSLFVMPLL